MAGARGALVDYVFHVVLNDPSAAAIADIPNLAAAGHRSLKVFMVTEVFASRRPDYLRALRVAGSAGLLTLVHAEDHGIVAFRTAELLAEGKRGVRWFPESRPTSAEEIAVREAISYAAVTEAPILLVHLSSRRALDAVRAGRAEFSQVHAELRPIYLYLTREVFDLPNNEGAKYVGQPPLRDRADVEALWSGLAAGDICTVGTDHFPHTSEAKLASDLDFSTIPPGVSNLETLLPMLYSEGVRTGRISVERLVRVLAEQPAQLAGIAPRKGHLSQGADADIVIFDPALVRTLDPRRMQSKADYDPFEGRTVTGWPRYTVSRGEVICDNGVVTGRPGRGRLVARSA
jgi:dihydropyrimidinase